MSAEALHAQEDQEFEPLNAAFVDLNGLFTVLSRRAPEGREMVVTKSFNIDNCRKNCFVSYGFLRLSVRQAGRFNGQVVGQVVATADSNPGRLPLR